MVGKTNLILKSIPAIIALLAVLSLQSCGSKTSLKEVRELSSYPSGSAIEFFNDRIFLAGDDAGYLNILNPTLEQLDTVLLFNTTEKRIPKDIKADIESITVVRENNTPCLLLLGSGSGTNRNKAFLVNPATKERTGLTMDTFYQRLSMRGIKEINIEGFALAPGGFVLVNRGNKTYPKNYLIFTSATFWHNQATAPIRLVQAGGITDTSFFNGISGLDYSAKRDRLVLTVSTENTYSSVADGAIGKSYLWIINDLSSKRRFTAMNADKVIDLGEVDERFSGHKIESVCIISEKGSSMELVLVSDNDEGKSTLFRLNVKL